jgi:23S rRNA-/tRNA-specific pseudouridylate synthase
MAVRLDGQGATTLVHARGRAPRGLVCELELLTGRRHQARVHLAWAGLPIHGDFRYGASTPGRPGAPARLCLHAARLDLSAAIPEEMPVTAAPDAGLFGSDDASAT